MTTSEDILEALSLDNLLGAKKEKDLSELSEQEKFVYQIIITEPMSRDEIIIESKLTVTEISTTLSLLEIKGYIEESNGNFRVINW